MTYGLVLAIGILLVVLAVLLLLRKRLGWGTVLVIIGILVTVFAKPIEDGWNVFIAAFPKVGSPAATPTTAGTPPTGPQTSHVEPTPSPTSTTDSPPPIADPPVTDGPVLGPGGDLVGSHPPESVYLADSTRTGGGKGIVSERPQTIAGREYLHAIYMCSELILIPNINCNSDKATTWWAEYVAPADMRFFRTVVGLSDSSPGDCRVSLRLEVNGSAVFDKVLGAGDRYSERSWAVRPGTRVVFRVRPMAGSGRCMATLGDPRFTG